MDWIETLLSCPPNRRPPGDGRSPFQQDADRIVFSSAFRRLQNKTQVHPLPHTDFVRTRLTHSMEVASVGRSLGGQVARRLPDDVLKAHPHLAADLGDIVAAACLAHDIGNPPFGHTGEQAMQHWFADFFGRRGGDDLSDAELEDFLRFEGNAQGFRILTRLQMDRNEGGMRLMDATLGAFTKYPCASDARQKPGYSGRKKHGFMQAEAELFAALAVRLRLEPFAGVQAWRRYPLAYLVEAADDICYSIIDVEDGVKLGRIGFSEAEELFLPIIGADLGERYKLRNADEKLSTLRSRAIGGLIDACCAAFVAAPLEAAVVDATPHRETVKKLKTLAAERVYRWERTVTKELEGIAVIRRLLDLFVGALDAKPGHVTAERLLDLVPHYRTATTRYQRLLSITDYISGMTDRYAIEMQQQLRDISL